jgi:hypothetical protein
MKTIPLPFIIPALLATIVMFSSAAPGMEDLCLKKIPPDLRKQLIQSFPNDRFPTMGDIKKENIEEDLMEPSSHPDAPTSSRKENGCTFGFQIRIR